jgi:cysteinyl-tRNA synthetase
MVVRSQASFGFSSMQLYLTNTLTRRKEVFAPADPGRVTLYVCGSTVYNHPHIGNARPAVAFDVLFRLLRHIYGESAVLYASNYTDIDDKIIKTAAEAGVPINVITDKFARIYREDVSALGVLTPTFEPRATEHVEGMIALIQKLIDSGAAYAVPSGVYFSVAADPDYGKLSGRAQEDMQAGARVEGEDDKRHSSDFALWKASKPGDPSWNASFGAGRPGWHIECSAMIAAQLGETIDIHGGGLDLVFPHHENEIAQSECANHKPLARVWMHNGMLNMAREKMSKSLGNIVTVHELLEQGWAGETLRWALLSAHYRAPLDWSDDLLAQARASLDRLYGALLRLAHVEAPPAEAPAAFLEALADDLNTPKAIAELSALGTAANVATKPAEQAQAKAALIAAGALMGVLQDDPSHWFRVSFGEQAAEIDALVAERVAARSAKNFAEADRLRGVLAERGVEVMDNPTGSTWRRKS